jgi:hypothetical protein
MLRSRIIRALLAFMLVGGFGAFLTGCFVPGQQCGDPLARTETGVGMRDNPFLGLVGVQSNIAYAPSPGFCSNPSQPDVNFNYSRVRLSATNTLTSRLAYAEIGVIESTALGGPGHPCVYWRWADGNGGPDAQGYRCDLVPPADGTSWAYWVHDTNAGPQCLGVNFTQVTCTNFDLDDPPYQNTLGEYANEVGYPESAIQGTPNVPESFNHLRYESRFNAGLLHVQQGSVYEVTTHPGGRLVDNIDQADDMELAQT